ncbi:MAG TPA: flagellar assembly protein FliW [Thermodesulfobacteriota bacterium]|nr:flagellar assembly protein FliW [Thermodesulfobacteriota bacterium]
MSLSIASKPAVEFMTARFGLLSVDEDKIIHFVNGLPGFRNLRKFILLDHDGEGTFKWLQSIEEANVAFLMTNPALFKPDYTVPLKRPEIEGLAVGDPSALVSFVMVCVSRVTKELSLNLKGPVVFNSENMRAIQCIIDREDYPSHFVIKA